jgi:large subunit ribosomal protein L25
VLGWTDYTIIFAIMITLNAEARNVKVNPKIIRRGGKIPAVFYGQGQESTPIMVERLPFIKLLEQAGESAIFSLVTPKGTFNALIHDVGLDPVLGDPIHVDFYITAKDHKLSVDVPLQFVGTAPVEKDGGVIVRVMHELRVDALPAKLPQHITVDLAMLDAMGAQIVVGDLVLGDGVTAHGAPTDLVAMVSAQREEEEAPVSAPDIASIEVEKKGKKEEEEPVA